MTDISVEDSDKDGAVIEEEEDFDGPSFSIFSEEQQWFKHNKYEVYRYKGHSYIRPTKDAIMETYNPYKMYPQILEDFFSMVMDKVFGNSDIELEPWQAELFGEEPIGEEGRYLALQKKHYDRANILVDFYNKYGPLGTFFEELLSTGSWWNKDYVHLKMSNSLKSYLRIIKNEELRFGTRNSIVEYEKYARLYFPWLPQVPKLYKSPDISNRIYGDTKISYEFKKHYAEDVALIIYNELLLNLSHTINAVKQLRTNKPIAMRGKNYIAPFDLTHEGFPGISSSTLGSFQLALIKDGESFKISWKAKSLLGILVLMYVENEVKLRTENLTVCKLEECMKLAKGRSLYCCRKHGRRQQKRIERAG